MTKKNSAKIRTVFLGACFVMTWTLPAQAYLDPGTGAIIVTAILGTMAAVGYQFRVFLGKIKQFLGLNKDNKEDE